MKEEQLKGLIDTLVTAYKKYHEGDSKEFQEGYLQGLKEIKRMVERLEDN